MPSLFSESPYITIEEANLAIACTDRREGASLDMVARTQMSRARAKVLLEMLAEKGRVRFEDEETNSGRKVKRWYCDGNLLTEADAVKPFRPVPMAPAQPPSIVFPTVHMNGTGGTALQDSYSATYDAVENALTTLCESEFNARDYYVQGPDAYAQAREQRDARIAKLRTVKDELYAILENVCDQVNEQDMRKATALPANRTMKLETVTTSESLQRLQHNAAVQLCGEITLRHLATPDTFDVLISYSKGQPPVEIPGARVIKKGKRYRLEAPYIINSGKLLAAKFPSLQSAIAA